MQRIKNLTRYLNSFSRRNKILAGVAVVVLLIIFFHLGKAAPASDIADSATHVSIASVASLSNAGGPLPVTGNVTSVSQASISALSGGEITSLPYKLGDRVAAGSVIASFENSSQRAAVLQAQGSYDAAVASKNAVSPIDTRAEAIATSRAAFNTLDTVLKAYIDTFFEGRTIFGPRLLLEDQGLNREGRISKQRDEIAEDMEAFQAQLANAESLDPRQLLQTATNITQRVSEFATQLADVAGRNGSEVTAEQTSALASARSSLSTLSTTLVNAVGSYRSDSVSTTASTDAQVTIALGGLRAAQAALEKTYVRAPISGTIVSLPVNRGDFISPGTQVAIISNPGALQVEAYVTSADAKTLNVGGKATIDETVPGTIVFIAPALDPLTGKIQVKVSPTGSQTALTDGSSVSVLLDRAPTGARAAAKNTISIPIAAAKMTPAGAVVFTVASSTLVAHSITLGAIQGGQVEVTQGLTADMDIVVDARGLSEGQVVVVDSE